VVGEDEAFGLGPCLQLLVVRGGAREPDERGDVLGRRDRLDVRVNAVDEADAGPARFALHDRRQLGHAQEVLDDRLLVARRHRQLDLVDGLPAPARLARHVDPQRVR